MKTIKCLVLVSVVVALAGQVFAGDATEQKKAPLLWKFSTTYVSKFVGYVGYRLSDDPVVQSELGFVAPQGWKAGVWWSTGTNDRVFSSDTSDEIQWTLGWTRTLSKTTLATEVVYMDFMPLDRAEKDVITPRIRLNRIFDMGVGGKFTTTVQVEDRISIPTRRERPTVTMGIQDAFKITERITLGGGVSALYDYGSQTADRGILLRWTGEVSVALAPRVTGTAFVRMFDPLTIEDKRTEQTVFGLGITMTF
ncbi:hypothetical protein HY624_03545 [Candidatus Uhrbacteria bacterium]|nr:hypothetical protein [Candidatus Uhrbacteria bacterium]